MTYEVVSVICGGGVHDPEVLYRSGVRLLDNRDNKLSPCQAYQQLLETSDKDVVVYVHDDVTIHDDWWLEMIVDCFKDIIKDGDSKVVAVGLGGATALGNADLYRKPYSIWNMARRGYASAQTDAETHGERVAPHTIRRVAVLDAFCLAVRTDWLRTRRTLRPAMQGGACENASGVPSQRDGTMTFDLGWPVSRLTFHCLDLWLACEAGRDEKEIWMVGASCTHHGGGTSTKPVYAAAPWLKGGTLAADHQEPHRWLYNEYRDVLPIDVSSSGDASKRGIPTFSEER